ncbi:ATP-binding protein [Cellulomonas sp. ATA003]|uniref:ATP-binding protein n=1 Tax=Cellulomonas sp. ATA003 TaxID=3073064 RepID=UPI002873356E|nr:ATP-binding protein [Cellulomonas sp. ATA003]WNB85334.1 ATP-binding protein [Cellulomonas sp. ATA003]
MTRRSEDGERRTRPFRLIVGGLPEDAPRNPVPASDASEELQLPAQRSSARLARHWVIHVTAAAGVTGAQNQIVELLTAEVVANAAVHGPADGTIRVRAWSDATHVYVSVRDDSVTTPVVRHPEPSDLNGRGVALVQALASDWGVEAGPNGKTVWFSLELEDDL